MYSGAPRTPEITVNLERPKRKEYTPALVVHRLDGKFTPGSEEQNTNITLTSASGWTHILVLGRNEGGPERGAVRTQAQQVQRHQEGVLRHIFSLEQVGMSRGAQ